MSAKKISEPFTLSSDYFEGDVQMVVQEYAVGSTTAITLMDVSNDEPAAKLTINTVGVVLRANEVIVKTWSENKGILESLIRSGHLLDTGRRYSTGFCLAPVCEFFLTPQQQETH